ncbi:unnamed protein product [Cylindrotheca closterium]|uniref:Aspartate/glutamate/uridylate kinase domain-containing protein n=1 Tax=Cylindrotheca closterium TaxID=2856 RepID=A0AAD2CK23_9STRA|nr:unnamed protein product [Cylindrotheca closterium]
MLSTSIIQRLVLVASAVISVDAFMSSNQMRSFSKRVSGMNGIADHIDDVASEIKFFNDTVIGRNYVLEDYVNGPAMNPPKFDVSKLEFVSTCGADDPDESCSVNELYSDMIEEHKTGEEDDESYPYVDMIRGSAPYIANHRGELAVIHVPGDLLSGFDLSDFMNDITLCWLLGMKIVVVVGCRKQVEERLNSMGQESAISGHTRITSKEHMRIVEEEAGFARFEVERRLHRSLRCSQLSAQTGNVVSGNFFKASRFGIVNGVDFESTGRPKQLNVKRILDYLKSGEIVLMTSVGIDLAGDVLNVNSEALAAFTAASLCANKLVYCSNTGMVLRNKETKMTVQNFRSKDAKKILEHFNMDIRKDYFMSHVDTEGLAGGASEMLVKIGWACKAIRDGVDRAHIIAPSNGALIEELFTAKQGTGTCISEDTFESVHPDDDSGDFVSANEFAVNLSNGVQSDDDPDWPADVPKDTFPWQARADTFD